MELSLHRLLLKFDTTQCKMRLIPLHSQIMNIVAFGVSMPLSRFMTDVFPFFALQSLPFIALVALLQIVSIARSGAFSDARREWIAPSIILTVVAALFLRLVFYMFFADVSLLSAYSPYAGFMSLHVLLSSGVAGYFFVWLTLSRSRAYQSKKDIAYYLRSLMLSCVLMSLPTLMRIFVFSQEWLIRVTWFNSFYEASRLPLYFIAVPAFIWHVYLLKHLVQVAKKSKALWVGSGIVYWTLPVAYFGFLSYLFSQGRYNTPLNFWIMLGGMVVCVVGNFSIVRSVRRMVREQLKFEEFVREREQADR